MTSYLLLAGGVLAAAAGGEFFVRGLVGLARWARIPASIVGATIAAFATSSPEMSVAVSAAVAGKPQIALGDALGSNVVNIALILGVTLCISGIQAPRDGAKRDFPVALAAPAVLAVLALDGTLSRFDGVILLGLFCAWLTSVALVVRRQRDAPEASARSGHLRDVVASAIGMLLLIVAGRAIVSGAGSAAAAAGIDAFVIGATVVAFGTSAPELATAVIAKLRGHDEIGLGTVLGSNIFNGLLIIGLAAIISPILIDRQEVMLALAFGVATAACTFPSRGGFIGRWRGPMLLALYVFYTLVVVGLAR